MAVNGSLQPPVPEPGPEPSYLNVALMVLGLSLFLLFVVKWFYQSRRYRRTRFSTEDNWLGLSVLQRVISSKSLSFGDEKSGILVGLFGSPLWETRYSAFRTPENTSSDPAQTALKPGPCRRSGSNFLLRSFGLSNRQPEIFRTGRINKPCTTPGHTSSELLPVLIPAITSNSYPIWNPEIGTEVRAQQSAPSASSTTAPQRLFSSASVDKRLYPSPSVGSSLFNSYICRMVPDRNILCTINYPELAHIKTPCDEEHISNLSKFRSTDSHSQSPHFSGLIADGSLLRKVLRKDPCGGDALSRSKSENLGCQDHDKHFKSLHNADECCISVSTAPIPIDNDNTQSDVSESTASKSCPAIAMSPSRKRSPNVGPSPLRTMFLLDSGTNGAKFNGEHGQYSDTSWERLACATSLVDDSNNKSSRGRRNQSSMYYANKCHKKKSENQASESLLTLIQELVQETSAWDDSLFVDHKFKAMINDSKQIVTVSLPNQHQRLGKRTASYGSRLGRSCIKALEGIPELEVEG